MIRILLLLLVVSNSYAHAQTPLKETQSLKELVAKKCEEHHLPALWAGRFTVDGGVEIEVAGHRKWKESSTAQIDDIVHLGSCTKAMTAVVIGQLCTEGKLTLDTPLKAIFTDTPNVAESTWGEVKIIELMQHRSGAVANLDWGRFDKTHPDDVIAARQMMWETLIKKRRPATSKFLYSNVGFALLGHVVEKIEHKSWEQSLRERLFERLKMNTAGFGPVGKPDSREKDLPVLDDRAWGHTPAISLASVTEAVFGSSSSAEYQPVQFDNSPSLGPAGRVHMNLRDWSQFVLCFARSDGHATLGISADVWQKMITPPPGAATNETYAAGWIVFDKPAFGGQCYFHNGSNTSWYAYALAVPNKKCCVLVASNVLTNGSQQSCDEIARKLIAQ